ncbi:MAG: DUF2203 domain-containing protein [Planctomycetota bacterium]
MTRLFKPADANRTLPLVKRIVADILEHGRDLRRLANRRDRDSVRDKIERLEAALRANMQELEQIGCSYKDWSFEVGLVDFPAKIGGRPVLLCWRSDEESVEWFHSYEEGYSGRCKIPEPLLKES